MKIRKHPYKCGSCSRRKSLPKGTLNGAESCEHCGGNMNFDRCRVENDSKSRGVRCDCNGTKTKKMAKFVDHGGVTLIVGPHRKGQVGCMFHPDYGKTDEELERELDDIPFPDTDSELKQGQDCPF